MEIKIMEADGKPIVNGKFQYTEEQSKQEGKLSFFLATSDGFDIEFFPENIEEMNSFIQDLTEIRDSMQKKVDNKEI